jgi:branched-chain amino acid transport system permease protein
MAALYFFVHHTRLGTAIRATAIDQDAARLMGINVNRVIALVFIIGPVLGAIGGLFIGLYYRQTFFTMGWSYGLNAFIAAIIGGIGNIPGAMLGGLVLGLFNAFAAGYISSSWQDAITFALLIGILLVRPSGLLGERVAEKV